MRITAAAIAFVFGLTAAHPALAGKCYVDSDCPTGTVCNFDGGCVVPEVTGAAARPRSNAVVLLGVVVIAAVVVAILIPAMRATDEASGVRAPLDDLRRRDARLEPVPATCGLTLRF